MTETGKLIVISGPSGAGKSTVIARAMSRNSKLRFSVSATTRPPRDGEVHGVNYYFVGYDEFKKMILRGEFLEHAEYVSNLYGTPAAPVRWMLEQGYSVILDIEVVGAAMVKAAMPDAVMIFLIPKSFHELERRIRHRDQESEGKTQARLETAKREYLEAENYEYIIINDDPDIAANELLSIVTAETCKTANRISFTKIEEV